MSAHQSSTQDLARQFVSAVLNTSACQKSKRRDWFIVSALQEIANKKYKVQTPHLDAIDSAFTERAIAGTLPDDICEESVSQSNTKAISSMKLPDNFQAEVARISNARVAKLFARYYTDRYGVLLEHGRVDRITGLKGRKSLADVQSEHLADLEEKLVSKSNYGRTYAVDRNETRLVMDKLRSSGHVLDVFGKTSLSRVGLSDNALLCVFKEYTRDPRLKSHIQHHVHKTGTVGGLPAYSYVTISERAGDDVVLAGVLRQLKTTTDGQDSSKRVAAKLAEYGVSLPAGTVPCEELALPRMFMSSLPSLGVDAKSKKVKVLVEGEHAIDSAIVLLGAIFNAKHKELLKKHKLDAPVSSRASSPVVQQAPVLAPNQFGASATGSYVAPGRPNSPSKRNPSQGARPTSPVGLFTKPQ